MFHLAAQTQVGTANSEPLSTFETNIRGTWLVLEGCRRHTVSGVIVAYVRFLPANRPWLRLSLGLQLGGELGNLIDRLRQGYVVDFISVKAWLVFNIADACVVVGVLILAYHLLLVQGQAPLSNQQSAVSHQHRPDPHS